MKFKSIASLLALSMAMIATSSCVEDSKKDSSAQTDSQAITESYTKAAQDGVQYPQSEMTKGGWLERRLLKENLLRQNNKDRIAYVTLLNQQGQPITQYTIQGMVFSLNSQMTTEDIVEARGCGSNCGYPVVTKAAGDNGTWGPEPDGISFFTTEGVQVKWNGLYLESDSPMNLTTKPLIVYDASTAQTPETAVDVKSTSNGGINTGN